MDEQIIQPLPMTNTVKVGADPEMAEPAAKMTIPPNNIGLRPKI